MKNRIKKSLAFTLLIASFAAQTPVFSCAFSSEDYFTYTVHPDLPLDKYASGQLDILKRTYARSYLLVAYRYLEDKPLNDAEQKSVLQTWNDRLKVDYGDTSATSAGWLKARSAVPGAAKLDPIEISKPISSAEPWQTFCNCQPAAFQNASDTLKGLITKYGASSSDVKDWLKAQDQVFANCGYPSYSDKPPPASIPTALPKTAEQLLQKYRDYQIAASNFYAQNFELAKKEFDAIAADPASPLKHIAPYMSVRCLLRQASLAKSLDKNLLLAAQTALNHLQDDPSYKDIAVDLEQLSSFIDARIDPAKHVRHLLDQPYTNGRLGEITKTLDMILKDGDDDADKPKTLPDNLKNVETLDWLITFKNPGEEAKKHAIERWEKTHSTPWLLAAATKVDAKDPQAGAILTAADQVLQKNNSAKWSLFYNVNQVRLAEGKNDQVRSALDEVLNKPESNLPAGAANQLRTQRLRIATSLDEFVRYGFQTPLSSCSNGLVSEFPDEINDIIAGKPQKQSPVFTAEAGLIMQKKLPLSSLIALANNTKLPQDQRNNIAWTSWVRAVLLGDDPAARQLASIAKPFNKQKTALFDAYLNATTPEQKLFAATFLMLHFSSAQPNPQWDKPSEDAYGDSSGWWWSEHPTVESISIGLGDSSLPTVREIDPLFLNASEKAQAKQQLAKLGTVPAAPNYFAKIVLAFAQAHPDDPRVPEALHWFVKSTRYGVTDDSSKTYSKRAFDLLHAKYKTNPWTKKTPYFY